MCLKKERHRNLRVTIGMMRFQDYFIGELFARHICMGNNLMSRKRKKKGNNITKK